MPCSNDESRVMSPMSGLTALQYGNAGWLLSGGRMYGHIWSTFGPNFPNFKFCMLCTG